MISTFLMTDIEGSARLWDENPDAMSAALLEHDRLVERIVTARNGRLIKSKGEGDSTFSVFEDARDAARAAIELQSEIARTAWPTLRPIKVRAALDTGEVESRDGDLFGPVLNRCARLRSAGHGGQILLSSSTANDLRELSDLKGTLRELGVYRLKGLKEPQSIFQLSGAEGSIDYGPLRALDVRTHNLPVELVSLIGRDRERADILSDLQTHRLVTIWGPGGAGKTTLALNVASVVADEARDGAWWIDLVGIKDGALVVDQITHVLGLGDSKHSHSIEELCGLLEDRDLLLVLDNCEHLLDHLAEVASRLLAGCSRVRMVATSREPLGVRGEKIFPLVGLEIPVDGAPPLQVAEASAVRLFVDRAREAGCEVSEAEYGLVGSICKRLEGLPLAIELAAGALTTLALPSLAEEIAEHFDILDVSPRRDRGSPGRGTMRDAISWSFARATSEEQGALIACSVFAGSFELAAARRVADCNSSVILRLVEQSLISREPSKTRYRLLEPVRQFAATVPGSADLIDEARKRLLGWLVEITDRPDPETTEWLDLVESELDNVRAGLEASGVDCLKFCQLVVNVGRFWNVRGPLAEGIHAAETALELCDPSWNELRVLLLVEQMETVGWIGDFDRSLRIGETALKVATQLGDLKSQVRIHTCNGFIARIREDIPVAVREHRSALALAREGRFLHLEGQALLNLGVCAYYEGDYDGFERDLGEALAISRRAGDSAMVSVVLYDLGTGVRDRGDVKRATALWAEAFELAVERGDQHLATEVLASYGMMIADRDVERAATILGTVAEASTALELKAVAFDPSELAKRLERFNAELGPERFEELRSKGADLTLEEAALFGGLISGNPLLDVPG